MKFLIHNKLKANIKEKLTAVRQFGKADVSSTSYPFCNACYALINVKPQGGGGGGGATRGNLIQSAAAPGGI